MPYKTAQLRHEKLPQSVLILAVLLLLLSALAHTQTPPADTKQKPEAPPAAGGPQGDIGPIAVPKKKTEEKPQERPAPRVKNPEGMGDFSLRVNVPLVNVDVGVLTKDGQFIPGLKKENFKILEDGVPQNITAVQQTEAPITAVLLVEFANQHYAFINDMLSGAYSFTGSLKPEDWVAVMTYDMRTSILQDFTQDKRAILGAINMLRVPGFSETNLFDALYEALDRVDGIEGRKYIVVISSGYDSFSRITYDKILAKVKETQNVTIYTVSTGQALRLFYESRMGAIQRLDFLQADNQMRTFAQMTGGRFYAPRFEAEMPEIFRDIAQTIRNQYLLTYRPTNSNQDGTFRKLKIELVDEKGGPLTVVDQKGKKLKFQVIAKEGYRAKQTVE
ncbi:MAG TPA: VWA domain-containing protein [Terriglobales bacterium]|nr:VWA domain-containing protein [Terriglobales bacterium]